MQNNISAQGQVICMQGGNRPLVEEVLELVLFQSMISMPLGGGELSRHLHQHDFMLSKGNSSEFHQPQDICKPWRLGSTHPDRLGLGKRTISTKQQPFPQTAFKISIPLVAHEDGFVFRAPWGRCAADIRCHQIMLPMHFPKCLSRAAGRLQKPVQR